MIISNAVHTPNVHSAYDSPYLSTLPSIERRVAKEAYSVKSGQEIYDLLKEKVSVDRGHVYPSSMMRADIIDSIYDTFGYSVKEMLESSLTDEEGTFTVYTAVLELEDRDYSKLLNEEWEVSESLGLYEKNIILRFL